MSSCLRNIYMVCIKFPSVGFLNFPLCLSNMVSNILMLITPNSPMLLVKFYCVFYLCSDLIVTRNEQKVITRFKLHLSSCFHKKGHGSLKYFFGIKMPRMHLVYILVSANTLWKSFLK